MYLANMYGKILILCYAVYVALLLLKGSLNTRQQIPQKPNIPSFFFLVLSGIRNIINWKEFAGYGKVHVLLLVHL